jgi:hypothetical protein
MRTKVQSLYFTIAAGAAASLCMVAATVPTAASSGSVPSIVAPKASSGGNASAEKKICMKAEPLTGTRIVRDECRTRAEWEADGYTVTTRAKKKDAKR